MKKYTPMIEQYLAIKREYPDAFLFFRLGDFYELFFEDAVLAARELEITLTGRDGGAEERIPMCGVPHHAADSYINELIQKGYKVAVCEQVEDPREAKGVVKREVTRVITPGTMMEDKWLPEKENNYLVALAEAWGKCGVAACDISTGELLVTAVAASPETAWQEVLQFRPREVVVCDELILPKENQLTIASVPATELEHQAVEQQFGDQAHSLDEAMKLAVNTLLYYLRQTQKRSLSHLHRLTQYQVNEFLQIDPFSRRNLELTETIRDKQKKGSLLWLLDRTETAMGGRLLRRWIERPLLDKSKIEFRLTVVEQLLDNLLIRTDIRQFLHEIYDLERLAGRIAYGNANARDMVQLRNSLAVIPSLRELLITSGSAELQTLGEQLDECTDVCELLQRAFVDAPPLSVREGGLIREGYDPYLDKLREASRNGKQWIAQLEQSEREATGIRSLKIGFNKVFGYYIEVSRANLAHVPLDRYERKQTLANAERFVTQELKEKEALILDAEEKMVELEYQLFTAIREQLLRQIPRLQQLAEQIAVLDVLQSFATVSEERNFVRPQLVTNGSLEVAEGRHPVVEAVLESEQYVSNDAKLNVTDRQILLITGPNMAGKSTYMRQIALMVVMAQLGCFVPAKAAKLPLVDQIFTRIGAADDLVGGHSTFMVEMLETKYALRHATARSLILLDEIGRGTSTYDGMALAQAVIEYIHEHIGALTLFSTHYHELTRLEETLPRLVNVNARCEERDGKLLFLHKIEEGKADKSYGVHVAELADMPAPVINRARAILQELEKEGEEQRSEQLSLEAFWSIAAEPPQPALSAAEQAVLQELANLEINTLTPLEALNILAKLKERLQ